MLRTILDAIKLTRIVKTSRAYKRWSDQRHASKMDREGNRLEQMLKRPETSSLSLVDEGAREQVKILDKVANTQAARRRINKEPERKPTAPIRHRKR